MSFFTMFIIVFSLINFYPLYRIFKFFELKRNLIFYLVFFILTFSYMWASGLKGKYDNFFTQGLYVFAATWMGVIFITCCITLVVDLSGLFFKIKPILKGKIIIGAVIVLTVYSLINAMFIRIKEIEIKSPKINKNINFVLLSDIHFGSIHRGDYLQRIVDKVNTLKPDFVVIIGDLLDGHRDYMKEDFLPLNDIKGDVFFTTGNHDHFGRKQPIEILFEKTKMKVLNNESAQFDGVDILGIDYSRNKTQVEEVLPTMKINNDKFSILMYHTPDGYKFAADSGIDLMLAGHTHSGQIFPFNFVVAMFHRPVRGLHEYNDNEKYLYVTPGTGTWGPPMRLGSNNEITLIKLIPEK